ncbi:hypothetical protein PHLGIDRAFT_271516 [Phlebiopsis gigantea 11061_1 CR5-6]|uniref:Uncharacterized protein n=1 Tax=Phlebiopsis gigantea (strain 11061_1 CR5-6) TaxID=745531 RepID=A0A0C3NE74_PHLG1|nr:hypothetical protein PHLGIDRAFT_271516 [Phlebiopsis gigantea 11061_1 CR5-6]
MISHFCAASTCSTCARSLDGEIPDETFYRAEWPRIMTIASMFRRSRHFGSSMLGMHNPMRFALAVVIIIPLGVALWVWSLTPCIHETRSQHRCTVSQITSDPRPAHPRHDDASGGAPRLTTSTELQDTRTRLRGDCSPSNGILPTN